MSTNNNSILIFDLLELASLINLEIGPFLKPAPSGIYVSSKCNPIVHGDSRFFYTNNTDSQINNIDNTFTLDNLASVTSLYDHNLNVIYRAPKRGKNTLLTQPDVPVMARNMITDYIQHYLDNNNCWMPHENIILQRKNLFELWGAYLIDSILAQYSKEEIIEQLISIRDRCDSILAIVENFIGNNPWMMYSLKIKDFVFTIEKTEDYRIYDWHRQQELKMEKPHSDIFETAAAAEGLTVIHF
jgi:hypothetical protein